MDYHLLNSYYNANPLPYIYENEDRMLKDMEYLQQMYPMAAKKYQKKVSEILDRIDYIGSMIYDEYPDQMSLYNLAHSITETIRKEEQNKNFSENFEKTIKYSNSDDDKQSTEISNDSQFSDSEEKWEWVLCIVQIILYYEIFKRRHQKKKRIVHIY